MKQYCDVRSVLLAGSSAAVLATAIAMAPAPAMAQEQVAQDVVVVTGSRIARRDFQVNSPLVTIERDAFENRSNIGVEATLNQLPQFNAAGTESVASSAGAAFPGAQAAPGAATLSLRGLGSNRSLVLVNGRRAQPVNAQLVVDVNSIPTAAIQNVEVISGGAAAVYGADAIAGVVNFILRDDFEGFEFDAQYGITEKGDGQTTQVSMLIGGNFADGRGNAMLGGSWSERGFAWQRNREFYTRGWNDTNTESGGGSGISPMLTANVGGVGYGFNPDGTMFVANDVTGVLPSSGGRTYTGPLNHLAGGAGFKLNPASLTTGQRALGFNDPDNVVTVPLTRYSAFGSAYYDLTDRVTAFFNVNFTETKATAMSQAAPAGNIWALQVPYNAANDDPRSPTFGADPSTWYPVSPHLAELLNARPTNAAGVPGTEQPWQAGRGLNFLEKLRIDTTSTIYQLAAGLRGDFGFKDWTWEVYGSHGKTTVVAQQPFGAVSHANLQQMIYGTTGATPLSPGAPRSPSINGPWSAGWTNAANFNPQTCASGIPFFNPDGSVPLGIPNSVDGLVVSEDCIAYANLELNNVTSIHQNIVEATMQGGLFDIWAGEVRFAAGATYRDAGFRFQPDSGNSAEQTTTNVISQISLPGPTSGSISVSEVFGELLIPLVSDVPFIQQFDLELGGRYSDYDLSGGTETYKILGNWSVNEWLRFRGGYQLANRAPNIFELYAPRAGALAASNDPCVNIAGQALPYGNNAGNPNRINLQIACQELIVRDGGFRYTTLWDDPTAVEQDPSLGAGPGGVDRTRMSNHRWTLGYNIPFPFTVGIVEGNTNLQSEEAKTWTLGAVINSPFRHALLDRFVLTVDWYSINIEGTISTPSGLVIYQQCLDPQYNPLIASAPGSLTGAEILAGNPYCDFVQRYPYDEFGVMGATGSGTDRTVRAQYLNQGGTRTSGIDLALNWGAEFEDLGIGIPGAINFSGMANILLDFEESVFPGAPYVSYRGTAQPTGTAATGVPFYKYRLTGTLSYALDRANIGLRGRYTPSIEPALSAAPGTTGAKSHAEFDLFGSYMVGERYIIRGGVDNLFNATPPIFGATPTNAALNSTLGAVYDTLGRRFYVGVNVRL